MHCKACKYWNRSEEDEDGWGDCELANTQRSVSAHATLARAQDHESYRAWFHTNEMFGCVQYKKKEKAVWTCDATSGD